MNFGGIYRCGYVIVRLCGDCVRACLFNECVFSMCVRDRVCGWAGGWVVMRLRLVS